MQRPGLASARPDGGRMVDDDIRATRLQPLVDGSIEVGRRRAPGLDQVGVQVVVEQMQPQHIRRLRDLPHRHEVR